MANFTDNKIKNTYQRVLQVDNGIIQDGLGNAVSASISSITGSFSGSFDGILTGPTSESLALRVSNQENFSSSLDNTYATDNELEAVSSSLAQETAQLLDFSASLDSTFATDTELNASSSTLQSNIDNVSSSLSSRTSAQESFSSSLDQEFLHAADSIPTLRIPYSVGDNLAVTSSDNLRFNGDSQLIIGSTSDNTSKGSIILYEGADSSSAATIINNNNKLELRRNGKAGIAITDLKAVLKYSGSDRVIPESYGVRIVGDIHSTNIASLTGSLDSIELKTGSLQNSIDSLNTDSSSYALKTEITGSFTTLSSSLASRLSTNETDIISLGTTNNSQGTLIGNLTSATSSYAVGNLADYQLIVTSSSPSSNSYIIPAVVNCTPSGSTFLTGSPYEDVSILRLTYSGSNGTHTLTLPDATTTTNTYRSIRVISNGTVDNQHQVTLQPSASQTLDGGASGFSFNRSYEGVMVWSDGTEWFKVQAKNV